MRRIQRTQDNNSKKKAKPTGIDIFSVIKAAYKREINYSFFLGFMAELMIVLYLFVVQFFVDWIFGKQPLWVGVLSMLLFTVLTVLSVFFRTLFKYEASVLSMKMNRGISSVLFQKITKMSQVSLAKASAGKLVMMVSGELQTLESSL